MSENKATLKSENKVTLKFDSYDASFVSYNNHDNKIWGFLPQWVSEVKSWPFGPASIHLVKIILTYHCLLYHFKKNWARWHIFNNYLLKSNSWFFQAQKAIRFCNIFWELQIHLPALVVYMRGRWIGRHHPHEEDEWNCTILHQEMEYCTN